MTKFKVIKISEVCPFFYGPPQLFNKPTFENYCKSEDFSKIKKEEYFHYCPTGDYEGRGELVLKSHELSKGDIYINKESPIKEIFIPTTHYEIEINKFEDVLPLTNYSAKKDLIGNIKITNEELIIRYRCMTTFSPDGYMIHNIKVPNGVHSIYGVFDNSYQQNIIEERDNIESLGEQENDYEFNWGVHDWATHDPNIHFLYLNLK